MRFFPQREYKTLWEQEENACYQYCLLTPKYFQSFATRVIKRWDNV